MQVHIDTINQTVTMSLADFTNHFSGNAVGSSDFEVEQKSELSPVQVQTVSQPKSTEESVTSILNQLGVPRGILGFYYLKEAISIAIKNPQILNYITKDLYPNVAIIYKTTPSRAERAIRHAIEISWNRSDFKLQNEVFGCSVDPQRGKATNSQYIASVADFIRIKFQNNSKSTN